MGAILGGVMGESIARGQAAHFISGNGATQPMGLLTASTSGKTAAATTAVTISEIRDLIASVDPAYRPFSSLIMHDNTRIALMELKGGDGHYLWQPDLTKGAPLTFDGYPVVIDNSMASSLAASGKPIAFGVLNKYAIRDVNTIRIQRLTELHALTDQDSFVAFMETDANLLNAGTNPVKYLTMAAA
jgi:HK97 family phage major capsid protein